MNPHPYTSAALATLRQQELLDEAEHRRVARRLERVRRCRANEGPGTVRLLVNAALGRRTALVTC